MKQILIILSSIIIFSCNSSKKDTKTQTDLKQSKTNINTSKIDEKDTCKELTFRANYTSDFHILSTYLECEPDWKMYLKFYHNDVLIYEITDSREYLFDSTTLDFAINQGDGIYKILIERDDRPLRSQVDVFTFKNDKFISVDTIPYFEIKSDIDNDGLIEYGGPLETVEAIYSDSITYNPYIIYEINDTLFRFDSIQSVLFNKKIFGGFHGFKYNYDIQIHKDKFNRP